MKPLGKCQSDKLLSISYFQKKFKKAKVVQFY